MISETDFNIQDRLYRWSQPASEQLTRCFARSRTAIYEGCVFVFCEQIFLLINWLIETSQYWLSVLLSRAMTTSPTTVHSLVIRHFRTPHRLLWLHVARRTQLVSVVSLIRFAFSWSLRLSVYLELWRGGSCFVGSLLPLQVDWVHVRVNILCNRYLLEPLAC